MKFVVKDTASNEESKALVQAYTKKGFSLVTKKKNDKGGFTLTFRQEEKAKNPTGGIRLAAWIVGIVELALCGVAMLSMIAIAIVGIAMQNNDFCQKIIEEMIKAKSQYIPTIQELNNLGKSFIISGAIVFVLSGIALIPTIWTVASVKKTTSRSNLLGFAIVGFISLCAIPTGVLLCVVRTKIKTNPKQSK